MNNDTILTALDVTGKLMELHGENAFKAKAYAGAAYRLKKMRFDFSDKTPGQIAAIEGIGKGVAARIVELMQSGTTTELTALLEKTPPGVVEMLAVKGLGPKKVGQLWQELQIESPGELLYACVENRLVTLKGFGEKTQNQVRESLEFKLNNRDRQLYHRMEPLAEALVAAINNADNKLLVAITGQLARRCEIVDRIDILLSGPLPCDVSAIESMIPLKVNYLYCAPEEFHKKLVETSSTEKHLSLIGFERLPAGHYPSGESVYKALGLPYVVAERREDIEKLVPAGTDEDPLIELSHIAGILHNHSTYSDGMNTLAEMADFCRGLGYSYFGIADHSRSAGYAHGLEIERVLQQMDEIDLLNAGYSDFRILKGIESDILGDGSLDYPDEILQQFDYVVASVHSNLKMTEEKAMARLIRAIENPYTSILGHPTGRLLLSRPGYPLNHKKIIDACAANHVAIELNANPNRLDIDWRWIPECIEKGVKISINPDAHVREGILDVRYGVNAARKGGLTRSHCLNALPLAGLLQEFAMKG